MNVLPQFESEIARRKLRTSLSILSVSTLLGLVYALAFRNMIPSLSPAWHMFVNGATAGFLLGGVISIAEIHLNQSRLRHLHFPLYLLVQNVYYFVSANVIFFLVLMSHLVLFHDMTFREAGESYVFVSFYEGPEWMVANASAIIIVFSISFVRQINRMLGKNGILNLITGKYHKPQEEHRVFMFLDLNQSTTIAERLGHRRYHEFIDDFFYDITPAIIESKGDIYQYVGDEIIVTWTPEHGMKNADCINCFFRISAAVHLNQSKYEAKYGIVPTFKAGFHYGEVIAGLIGDWKRDLVFHGDTVNTAARICTECGNIKQPLLLSETLLRKLSIDSYLTPESVGSIMLKGKELPVQLFAIKEAA